ncbi:MAG: Spy/CpxP family protein refolding chaperone [Verrucomicrobia bacterium]|nr:Spy/CpxP family protein refolding chaperone [Verrucomicrobiota bacterium]
MPNLTPTVKKWIGGFVVLTLLLIVFPTVIAWRMQCVATAMTREISAPLADVSAQADLRLTKEQKSQIRGLEEKYQKEVCALCERHCAAKLKIGELLQAGRADDPLLLQLGREVGEAYSASEEATLRHVLAVCAILTPEQKTVFLKKVAGSISATCPKEFVR